MNERTSLMLTHQKYGKYVYIKKRFNFQAYHNVNLILNNFYLPEKQQQQHNKVQTTQILLKLR